MRQSNELEKHTFVFLGPSLERSEAEKILKANYLGPVAQGDIVGLLWQKPRLIVIIDGYFNRVPAVWHKEILLAISQGVKVFGAASMGALRAAELSSFGMVGVGEIYKWYQSGELVRDDEVAVLHAPKEEAYRPLSWPLVNVRATLAAALEKNLISEKSAAALLKIAQNDYYPERTVDSLLAAGKTAGVEINEEFRQFCLAGGVDRKRLDALECLQKAASWQKHPVRPAPPDFELSDTNYLENLIGNDLSLAPGSGSQGVTPRLVMEYGRLTPGFMAIELSAQLNMLAENVANLLGWEVTAEDLAAEAQRFWQERGIVSPIGINKWLAQNHCHIAHLEQILRRRFWLRQLLGLGHMPLAYYYLDLLRERGTLSQDIERAAHLEAEWQSINHLLNPEKLNDEQWALLLKRARKAVGDEEERLTLEQICALLGFQDLLQLVRQLLKEEGANLLS